jgi:hypothetical protein
MTAALPIPIAFEEAATAPLRERIQVLESRPGVREVLIITASAGMGASRHVVIVLAGGGGGFAVTFPDGVPCVQGGLPLAQRQRLASAIGGPVVALSPPTDQPVMSRAWRMSEQHMADLSAAVTWTMTTWPAAQTWVLGVAHGALSAAVAASSIERLAGVVLLSCADADESLGPSPCAEGMRVLAVQSTQDCRASYALSHARGRKTFVTVHDERAAYGEAANGPCFGGKEEQVVDVVARWIVTGAAPGEIR